MQERENELIFLDSRVFKKSGSKKTRREVRKAQDQPGNGEGGGSTVVS